MDTVIVVPFQNNAMLIPFNDSMEWSESNVKRCLKQVLQHAEPQSTSMWEEQELTDSEFERYFADREDNPVRIVVEVNTDIAMKLRKAMEDSMYLSNYSTAGIFINVAKQFALRQLTLL